MYASLKDSSDKLYDTPDDYLIYQFSSRDDVSFIHVLYGMNFGCVTYKNNESDV